MSSNNISMIDSSKIREYLSGIYLDWKNNYVSIATFSDNYGLYEDETVLLIELSRKVFNQKHPEEWSGSNPASITLVSPLVHSNGEFSRL